MIASTVRAADGFEIAAMRFEASGAPRACVVIAPAMAIQQAFYGSFAS